MNDSSKRVLGTSQLTISRYRVLWWHIQITLFVTSLRRECQRYGVKGYKERGSHARGVLVLLLLLLFYYYYIAGL